MTPLDLAVIIAGENATHDGWTPDPEHWHEPHGDDADCWPDGEWPEPLADDEDDLADVPFALIGD